MKRVKIESSKSWFDMDKAEEVCRWEKGDPYKDYFELYCTAGGKFILCTSNNSGRPERYYEIDKEDAVGHIIEHASEDMEAKYLENGALKNIASRLEV